MPSIALLAGRNDSHMVDLAKVLVHRRWEVVSLGHTAELFERRDIPHRRLDALDPHVQYDLVAYDLQSFSPAFSPIEDIDTAGADLLRRSALMAPRVILLTHLADAEEVIAHMRSSGEMREGVRIDLAKKALITVIEYERVILKWIDAKTRRRPEKL